jgi:hypothetical protein
MSMKCAPDMLALRLFPNAKEVSESFGAYDAARRHLFGKHGWDPNDPGIAVAAVGDGVSPRTAATFAFRTRWTCHAIDPKMRAARWHRKARRNQMHRVELWPSRVEDLRATWPTQKVDRLVIVAVHSHARLDLAVEVLPAREVAVIAIPCCVVQELPGREPDVEYQDPGILSPKNTIRVWRML